MNLKSICGLMSAGLFFWGIGSLLAENDVAITKYAVDIPSRFYLNYEGAAKANFAKGLPAGIGSGLEFSGKTKDGGYEFWGITDRGPNADSPKVELNQGESASSKIFAVPSFAPEFGKIIVKDNQATLVTTTTVKVNGKAITGLPLPFDRIGSTKEVPLNEDLKTLPTDCNALDTEGIRLDQKDGNLWICDEYGPFIAKINKTSGEVMKKYLPGNGLPDIIKYRQANRGFEGIAVTPNNKVYTVVQSILNLDGKVKKSKATFLRLVELNPATGKTKMFAYPHDVGEYSASADAKIGDLVALSNTEFLIIEQGANKDGQFRNLIYKIDLSQATDISNVKTADGKELETLGDKPAVETLGVKYIQKTLVLDLKQYGWEPEKAEGIAIIDKQTIAVISDNDFGIISTVVNPAHDAHGKPVKKVTKYTISKNDEVFLTHQKVNSTIAILPNNENTCLWIIKFPHAI